MIKDIWEFIQIHPWVSLTILVMAILIIFAFIEQRIYEHIPCHIWENGKKRNTPVLRHKRKNTYRYHGINGKWKELSPKDIEFLEEKRHKEDLHGKPIHPELHLN